MRLTVYCAAVASALLLMLQAAPAAHAGTVANWDKSARSWNNSHMTKIRTSMQQAGHAVQADAAITDQLSRASVLVIGEPTAAPSGAELARMRAFANAGGTILLFGDTGIDIGTYNDLLTALGSTIQFTTTTIGTSSAMADGPFTQNPVRIAGQSLSVTSGNGTTGGTLIDSNYVRYEKIGNGTIFVFGDRIDHDDVISATNTQLLLNIVAQAVGPVLEIPALSSSALVVVVFVLAALGATQSRRKRPIRTVA